MNKNNNVRGENTISLSVKPRQKPNVNTYENIAEPTVTYRHSQTNRFMRANDDQIMTGLTKRLNPRTGKMEDTYTKSCMIYKRKMRSLESQ